MSHFPSIHSPRCHPRPLGLQPAQLDYPGCWVSSGQFETYAKREVEAEIAARLAALEAEIQRAK